MKEQWAEEWWQNFGQYYDPDSERYPHDAIVAAYMAGYETGNKAPPEFLSRVLNSGDGVYRP